jgi:1-acyl-sn-glycerol-3-phosphate acyltransferase
MVRNGWLMNWRNKITIRVLPPVSAEDVQNRDIKDVMAEVRENMVETLAEIRKNK